MNRSRAVSSFLVIAVLCVLPLAVHAQDTTPVVSEPVQEAAETAVNQALTYIDSVATYLGQGVLYLLNLITDDRVSPNLEKPIGYLAFITLILLLFGLLDFARRIIWIGIVVGWALLVVRIVLDAIGA